MIRRLPLFVALLLMAKLSVGQNSIHPPSRSFNTIFDSLLISDNFIPVVEYKDTLPASLKSGRDSLVYDAGISYRYDNVFFKQLLDNPNYTDPEKINFLKAAIRNNKFYELNSIAIEFWKKNNEARQIMERYCLRENKDTLQNFTYLDFLALNALQGSTELIEEYFKKRRTLKKQHPTENRLLAPLIKAGKEKSALDILQMLVTENTSDSMARMFAGIRKDDNNEFDLLCFSKNNAIRTEARKLLWATLDHELNEDLFALAWHLDKKNATQCLLKRFQYYKSLDLGALDSTSLKIGCKGVRLSYKTTPYFLFMMRFSPWLGLMAGKELWAEFIARRNYWEFYRGNIAFYEEQLDIMQDAFKDSSLTDSERKQMRLEAKESSYSQDLVRMRANDISTKPNPDIHELLADIKKFELGEVPLQPDLPEYWCFKTSLLEFDENFYKALWKTGRTNNFEFYTRESSYKYLFKLYFEGLLAQKEITDIDVQETITKVDGGYSYQVFVRSNEGIFKKEFFDRGTSTFSPEGLVKMINLLLIKKQVKERLVEIQIDQSYTQPKVVYGLFEPEKLKLFLNKYGVPCKALNKVTKLMAEGITQ